MVKFHYREGRRARWADAVELDGRLARDLGPGWASKAVGCLTPAPAALVGSEADEWKAVCEANRLAVADAVRRALGAGPYDDHTGRGLTELEGVALAVGFAAFCRDLRDGAAHLIEAAKHGLPLPATMSAAQWAGLYLARREVSAHRDNAAARLILTAMAAARPAKK